MAYNLRYYKNIIGKDNIYRLEIYKKDSTASAIEIGAVLQGLSLEIQGQQADIDTPIVKTSLSMTFVDAGDLSNGKKNGFWEEFYTPNALLWQVVLLARKKEYVNFEKVWAGYVTPDSFSENLVYRGSVNIIARDNLGYLQDVPFDAQGDSNGMISLRTLVNTAWNKTQTPMTLEWGDSSRWLKTMDGKVAYDTLMNVSAFEDMSWYEALESALYAYGAVLRFAGSGDMIVCPLRYMPMLTYSNADSMPHITPRFEKGATRSLDPSVKKIEESVDYDLEDELPFEKIQGFTTPAGSYPCSVDLVNSKGNVKGTQTSTAPVHPISNVSGEGWGNISSSTLFFNPKSYGVSSDIVFLEQTDEVKRYQYIACNNTDGRVVYYIQNILCADIDVRIKLGEPIGFNSNNQIRYATGARLRKVTYSISIERNGLTRYYAGNGNWALVYTELTDEFDFDSKINELSFPISVADLSDNNKSWAGNACVIKFGIIKIEYVRVREEVDSSVLNGMYACIQNIAFGMPETTSLRAKNRVNTNYSDKNNVIISREPKIASAFDYVPLPKFIKNGIYAQSGDCLVPTRVWSWTQSDYNQMAIYVHLQLLAYYSKPNNVLSGTIYNADIIKHASLYVWDGREHILLGGTYNILTECLEGATLREFTRYEDMWEDVGGSEPMPSNEQGDTSNREGGTASSGATTYSSTANVNVGGGGGIGTDLFTYDESNDVIGTDSSMQIGGNLVVYGEVASTSDIRFKDIVGDRSLGVKAIADAPFFAFRWKGNEGDAHLHLGTSAQYWEQVMPEFVAGSEYRMAVNYPALGVGMGIAIAREVMRLTQRVEELEQENRRLRDGRVCE